MPTFFDKLSGGAHTDGVSPEVIDLAAAKESTRHALRRPPPEPVRHEPSQPHITVETQQEEEVGESDEEEGELTVDIYDKGDALVIQSTVAGVKPEHLDISITDDTVTIRGKRMRHEEVREENYYYKELFWGSFSRSVILPEEIDQERAEAHLQHGLLSIQLPKKRRGVTQKVKVKVA